RWQERGEGD
ncbi:Protein of unknown function, partial [Gryllus bimaculatus]